MRGATFAPQVSGIPEDADVITITAGGNDLNYLATIVKAGLRGWLAMRLRPRRSPQPAVVQLASAEALEQATDGLTRVARGAQQRAPRARVLLVDHLTVLGVDTQPSVQSPFAVQTVEALRSLGEQVDAVFAGAAERSGAELVTASRISVGHGVGSAEP